jgi:hypothetical protein
MADDRPLRLKKSLAESMAKDVKFARWKVLRKVSIEEAYELMRLMDDLEHMAHIDWLDSLATRYSRGQHHLGKHLEIDDPAEVQELADEIADDMRELYEMATAEDDERTPVTVNRLRWAEELIAKHGVPIVLVARASSDYDVSLN